MQDNVDRDLQHQNLEELLLDLRGSPALALSAYGEDDDSVTRVLALPQDAPDWLVAVNAREQRSLTTEELRRGLAHGELRPEMLVWRRGLPAWQLLGDIAELRAVLPLAVRPPAPLDVMPSTVRVGPAPSARPVAPRSAPEPRPAPLARPAPEQRRAEPARTPLAACAPPSPERSSAPAVAPSKAASTGAAAAPLVPPEIELERLALESGSLRLKRAVMGVSALAMTAVFVTLFALSSNSEDKVREAALLREAAAVLKAAAERETTAQERESAPSDLDADEAESEPPPRQSRPRERARGVPRGAAAMIMDTDESQSVEGSGRAGALEGARQRL